MKIKHPMQRWLPVAGGFVLVLSVLAVSSPGVGQELFDEPQMPTFTPVEPLGSSVIARPGSAEIMSLISCIDIAMANNDSLQAERERRAELDGIKYQALSTGLPTLDLVGDWSRQRDPSMALNPVFAGDDGGGMAPPPGSPDWFNDWLGGFGSLIPAAEDIPAASYWRTNFSLNWEINPVKIAGAVGAANLGIERQDLIINAYEHRTAESVIGSYFSVIMMAEAVNAIEAQYANQKELLELTKMRYELGFATRLDTLTAAVALANIEPDLRNFRQQMVNAGSQLNATMGRDPLLPLTIANEQILEDDIINQDIALELAMSRPELTSVERYIGILGRQKQTQVADHLPYLTAFGNHGWVGTDFDNQWETGHDAWSAGVALNVPIFRGLRTKGEVSETKAKIRRTERELVGFQRVAQVQALEIMNNLTTARQNLLAANLNLDQAEEALEEALLMYQIGKASYLTVLDSETNHLNARRTLIDARFQVLTLTASLKRAVGYSPAIRLADIPGLVVTSR